MMKIEICEMGEQLTVKLEGRLAGPWVPELEQCWHSTKMSCPSKRLLVDLTGVTYIDQAGQYLLQLLYRDGARFAAAGLMTQEIVDQITKGGNNTT